MVNSIKLRYYNYCLTYKKTNFPTVKDLMLLFLSAVDLELRRDSYKVV